MYSARVLMNGVMFGKDRKPGDTIPENLVSGVSNVVIKSMVNQGLIDLYVDGNESASIPSDLISDTNRMQILEAKVDKLYSEVFKQKKPRGRPAAKKQAIEDKESGNGTES